MRARDMYSPFEVSGYRDYTLTNAWRTCNVFQLGAGGLPTTLGSGIFWGYPNLVVLAPGASIDFVLYPIASGAGPPNTAQIDKVEVVVFDATRYVGPIETSSTSVPSASYPVSLTGTITGALVTGSVVSTGTYTFTGVGGTTNSSILSGYTTTASLTDSMTGTITVPSETTSTTYVYAPIPTTMAIGLSLYLATWTGSRWNGGMDISIQTNAHLDAYLDYALDVYDPPTLMGSFSGRSFSVSLPSVAPGFNPFQFGAGNALLATLSNFSTGAQTFTGVPFIRALVESPAP
jgi:hypothetical protein